MVFIIFYSLENNFERKRTRNSKKSSLPSNLYRLYLEDCTDITWDLFSQKSVMVWAWIHHGWTKFWIFHLLNAYKCSFQRYLYPWLWSWKIYLNFPSPPFKRGNPSVWAPPFKCFFNPSTLFQRPNFPVPFWKGAGLKW